MNTAELSDEALDATQQGRAPFVPPPPATRSSKDASASNSATQNVASDVVDATLDRPLPAALPSAGLTDGHVVSPTDAIDATLDRPSGVSFPSPTRVRQGGSTVNADSDSHPPTLAGGSLPKQLSAVAPPSPAADLAGYEILGVLGRGGMGVVYKARQKGLNRLVALKMISGGANAPAEILARFRLEGEAVAKLRHPNIVEIYEVGQRDGNPFFSLEFLEGDTLQKRFDGAPLTPMAASELMEKLARAMQFAHEHGIVHRDLKPANVLFTAAGVPKIADFGLAKRIDTEDLHQTATDAVLGTPTYMAPEQAEGRTREVGPAADLYSLGAILYDLLTGRPPFRGTTVIDTLQMVRFAEPVPPRTLQPKVPVDLQTICLKCLEKDPRKRYASCALFADDLRAFQEGRAVAARPTPAWERAWKWTKRRPALATMLVGSVCALLGVIVGLYYYAEQQKSHAEREKGLRKEADEARDQATKKEQEAVLAREKADLATKRAEQNYLQAKRAVDDLAALSRKRLLNMPGAELVRKEVLEKVVKSYEEFDSTQPKGRERDRPLELSTARAYGHLGDLRQLMHLTDEAASYYRQALGLYRKLLGSANLTSATDPDDVRLWKELTGVRINLWAVLEGNSEQQEAAENELREAQQTLEKLAAAFPADESYRFDLAGTYNNQSIRFARRKETLHACERSLRAMKTFDDMSDRYRARPKCQLERARMEGNLGVVLADFPYLAENQFQAAVRRLRRLTTQLAAAQPPQGATPDPLDADCRKELGAILLNLGLVQARNQFQDAHDSFSTAISLFEVLSREAPEVPDYRHLLATGYFNRGVLAQNAGRFPAARLDFTAARDRLEELKIFFTSHPEYRLDLARTFLHLGEISRSVGDEPDVVLEQWTAALALLKATEKEEPKSPIERALLQDTRSRFLEAIGNLINLQTRAAREAETAHRWAEANRWLEALLASRTRIAEVLPSPEHANHVASTKLSLALLRLTESGDKKANYKGAAQVLAGLQNNTPEEWGKFRLAAAALGRCMLKANDDRNATKDERTRLVREFGEQCLPFLRLAVKNEWRELNNPGQAAEYELLRSWPEFQTLLRELDERRARGLQRP